MRRLSLALFFFLAFAGNAVAQEADSTIFDPTGHFVVYTGDGEPAILDDIVARMGGVSVVFLGEQHNDPTAHALQLILLQAARHEFGGSRRVVLGMEMFERDMQQVLDEYLAGYIREQDFLKASRPWSNYETDYRPLVEFAREYGIPVVATNAPARYVSLARRRGLAALDSLMSSWNSLPHRPPRHMTLAIDMFGPPSRFIERPSAAYEAKFGAEMEEMGAHGSMPGMPSVEEMLVAQNLRDATMAFWIGRQMVGRSLVIHVNGLFHSENRLGIPEHLKLEHDSAPMLVVTMRPVEDINAAPEATNDNFIILTEKGVIEED